MNINGIIKIFHIIIKWNIFKWYNWNILYNNKIKIIYNWNILYKNKNKNK